MVLAWTYKEPHKHSSRNLALDSPLVLSQLQDNGRVSHFLFSRLYSYLQPHSWKWGAGQQVSRKRTTHWIWPMPGPCFHVSPHRSSQLCSCWYLPTLVGQRKSSLGSPSQPTQELLQSFDSCQPSLQVHNTIWYHSGNQICISYFLVYASNPRQSKNRPACLLAVTYYFKTSLCICYPCMWMSVWNPLDPISFKCC